jgi:hypothetical protein
MLNSKLPALTPEQIAVILGDISRLTTLDRLKVWRVEYGGPKVTVIVGLATGAGHLIQRQSCRAQFTNN